MTSNRRKGSERVALIALGLLWGAGCSNSTSTSDGGGDASGPGGGDLTMPGGGDMAMNLGPGNVTGTFGGSPFGTVQTAWMIGAPDAANTTVIYLFSAAVDCHDANIGFGVMGWDAKLPDKTQFLEIKLAGPDPANTPPTMPGDYKVVTRAPAAGEASVNHSLSHKGAASMETVASGGKITLQSIVDQMGATGTFTIKFGNDTLAGRFNAGFCDIGVEP